MSTLISVACVRTSEVRVSIEASVGTRLNLTGGWQQNLVFSNGLNNVVFHHKIVLNKYLISLWLSPEPSYCILCHTQLSYMCICVCVFFMYGRFHSSAHTKAPNPNVEMCVL